MLHNMSNETPLIISRASGWTSMTKFNSPSPLQSLVRATALPLVLLAAGALPAFAGSVTVTGANGRNTGLGTAGAGGSATATRPHRAIRRTPPQRPAGMAAREEMRPIIRCFFHCPPVPTAPGVAGGAGGTGTATATTSISSTTTLATVTATSVGGGGGAGGSDKIQKYVTPMNIAPTTLRAVAVSAGRAVRLRLR